MKAIAKVSGKKLDWQEFTPEVRKEWSFERRPGGWVIATRSQNGVVIERNRFYHSRTKQNFFSKLTRGTSLSLFGEKIDQARAGAKGGASADDYVAQFPGKVRKISVREGDVVTAGTPLLMVEAMKMEFAIKAATDGVVKKILVEEGATLTPNQKLLDFEEKK